MFRRKEKELVKPLCLGKSYENGAETSVEESVK